MKLVLVASGLLLVSLSTRVVNENQSLKELYAAT